MVNHLSENDTSSLENSFEEWEESAEKCLRNEAFDYIARGSGAEETMKANVEAFQKWRIRPRVLRDVSERDLSVSLFGHTVSSPLLFAPIGVQAIVHPQGELASAKAASEMGALFITSSASSFSMEEIAAEMEDSPRWFQLYCSLDDSVTKSLVQRAEACGYSAIVITVDTPMLGFREADLRNGYSPLEEAKGIGNYITDPAFCKLLKKVPQEDLSEAIQKQIDIIDKPGLTWEDIEKVRTYTHLPILLKGVVHPDDAKKAVDYNLDGLIVSNHGGRQLDSAISSLDALVQIQKVVYDRIPILVDGGVRRGTDVIKALALGAKAVLVGRPYVYGLTKGKAGVKRVIQHILNETDITMALSGVRSVKEIDSSLLVKVNEEM
ncbi:alpha-hydroxy-acid oxidizing protein [Halobacillus hunanensis]|uniref:alpha-hydroxy-acid oxidizing protein n=1 Tax=Halobacillus hunanensis TaxID=578214 RepID=UPI0009A571CA|nr:alpha-hydroxy-acid oxidizing protein [Halobacillus hunanensis]